MIELNLLPETMRSKGVKTRVLKEIAVVPIVTGIAVTLISTYIFLLVFAGILNTSMKHQNVKWNTLKPDIEKIESIKKDTAELERKASAIRTLANLEPKWAGILNGLNQAVIQGVWLSDFDLKIKDVQKEEAVKVKAKSSSKKKASKKAAPQPTVLVLKGYAVGQSSHAAPLVAKLITSLKQNNDLNRYFEEVELKNMHAIVFSKEEVMSFQVECLYKTQIDKVKK